METKNFKVSENTAKVLNTLKSFHDFRELYFDVLVTLYGETSANTFYEDSFEALEAVEKLVGAHLLNSVSENMNTVDYDGAI